jgi:hypothetical protein
MARISVARVSLAALGWRLEYRELVRKYVVIEARAPFRAFIERSGRFFTVQSPARAYVRSAALALSR